jgi:hypothetical protein
MQRLQRCWPPWKMTCLALTADEFAKRFGWKNDAERVTLAREQ